MPVTGTTQDTGTPWSMCWDMASMTSTSAGIRTIKFDGTPVNGVFSGTPTMQTTFLGGQILVTGWPLTTLVKWRAGLFSKNNGSLSVEWYNEATSSWVVAIQQQNMNSLLTVGNNFNAGQVSLIFGMSNTGTTVATINQSYSGARMTDIVFKSDD
jgi:hypothetical protein